MATTVGVKLKIDGEKEYKQSIKNINQETKTLDAQLKSVSKAFDEEKAGMTKAEKQSELLNKKQEALNKELDQMNDYLDKVNEAYGENSIQAMKVEEQIAKTESKLADTNSALEDLASSSETSTSALDDLTATIADQESQLDDLREQYVNAVLEFGEGSDEASSLADEISNLSDELDNNRDTLDNATGSYDDLISKQEEETKAVDDMSTASEAMGTVFGNTTSGIVTAITAGDFMGAIGSVLGIFEDIVNSEIEMRDTWTDASGIIAAGTGALGDALDELKEKAQEAWASIAGDEWTEEEASQTVANLNTFLGLTGEDDRTTALANKFGEFMEVTRNDASDTVAEIFKTLENTGELKNVTDLNDRIQLISDTLDTLWSTSTTTNVSVDQLMSGVQDSAAYFQEMGYSTEEAVEQLGYFVAMGGDVSTYTSTLKKFWTALSGKTDEDGNPIDIKKAWDEALDNIGKAETISDAMSQDIEGISAITVLGKNNIRDLWTALHNGVIGEQKEYNDNINTTAEELHNVYVEGVNASEAVDLFAKKAQNLSGIPKWIAQAVFGTGNFFDNLFGDGSTFTNLFGIEDALNNASDKQKSAISNKLSSTSIWDWLKEGLGFADGYDQAYLLSNPTIFGMSASGAPLIGGDGAGNEVVVGESHLLSMIQSAVSSDGKMDTMINLLVQYLPQMNNQNIYLDGDVLVGQTASKMDRALGRL